MTYQAFMNKDEEWEVWNIKEDYIVFVYSRKEDAIRAVSRLNKY